MIYHNSTLDEINFSLERSENSSTLSFQPKINFTGDDFTCSFTKFNKTASHTFKVRVNGPFTVGYIAGIAIAAAVVLILISLLARAIHLNKVQVISLTLKLTTLFKGLVLVI